MELTTKTAAVKRLREESGVTLLELMFASGIMAIALSMLFGSLVSISVVGRVTASRATAVTHLSSVLEDLRSRGFPDLLTYTTAARNELRDETIQVKCVKTDGSLATFPIASGTSLTGFPNPLQVQCTITWLDQQHRTQSITGSELLYR